MSPRLQFPRQRPRAPESGNAKRPDNGGITLLHAHERTNYPLALSVDDLGEGFVLTAQVAKRQKWGAEEIRQRQADLAVLASKTWPREPK